MSDIVLPAELDHGGRTFHAGESFKRSRLVVNPRVNNAAVVTTLVASNAVFFFCNQQVQSRKTSREFHGDRKSNDSPTNHYNVITSVRHFGVAGPPSPTAVGAAT